MRRATARPRALADAEQLDHDLRSTLADLVAGLELIADAEVSPAARPALRRARAAVAMMCRMLEATNSPPDDRPPAPADLLRFALVLRDRWQDDGRVEVTADPALAGWSVPDGVALERLVANLVWNGARHGGPGPVVCRIGIAGQELSLIVTDRGPGFPPEMLAAGRGAGLGLVIATQMASRLGGALTFRNTPGGGAEVTFRMPLGAAHSACDLPADPPPDLSGLRILVAEDSDSVRLMTGRVLSGMGAEVELCASGTEAVERLAATPFDVAVLDVEMPGLDGRQVLQMLGEEWMAQPRPACVMQTGHSRRDEREALRCAGADAVLLKPMFCPYGLGGAVLGAVARRKGGAAGVPVLPDETTLRRLLQIAGPEAGAELMFRLLDDLQAVEDKLLAASGARDYLAIRAQTHVLVSVAGAVGAVGLQRMAEQMNLAAHGQDQATIDAGLPRLLTTLDALIRFVADRQPGGPAGAGA